MDTKGDKAIAVKSVELDAHAALKIIKFSRESKLGLSGALLGVETEGRLVITNSYPLPKLSIPQNEYREDYEISAEIEKQREVGKRLMEYMQMISEDSTTVGWYQSSLMGDYINDVTLQSQYQLQTQYPRCVCLIFEVSLADQSLKCFKAIRLTSFAMKTLSVQPEGFTGARLTEQDLAKVGMRLEALFEEVPIVMRRAHLFQQFMAQEYPRQALHINSGILQIFPEKYAISHMMYLNGYLSGLVHEQGRMYENKRRGKKEGEADNTSAYLLGNQILASCKELNDFMALTATKQKLLMKLTGVDKKVSTGL